MKCTPFALAAILATAAATSSELEAPKSNLRDQSRRLQSTRQSDWIDKHNGPRKTYQVKYGGTYSKISWSNTLKNKAATLAKSFADDKCKFTAPTSKDYGINFSASQGSATVNSVQTIVNSWMGGLNSGYPSNGSATQVLWSATKYVGCADSYNASEKCYATVCLYAKVS